jgi:predicted amidohydrolase
MLRIAVAQFRPTKAEYGRNLEQVGGIFRRLADGPVPDVVVFPEAALTGYFLEGGVQEVALSAEHLFDDLARLHRESGCAPLEIVVGFYEVWRTRLHNAVMAAALGGQDAGIRHVHRKVFLPTYGVFDEERFVEPGLTVEAFDMRWGRAAAIVCEDAWHSLMPTIAALDGAQVLFIPSASPARGIAPDADGDGRPGSVRRWERTVQALAAEHGFYIILAQLAGFEGGKALSGGSLVVGPRGEVLARAPLFEEALLTAELDLHEITRARAETPLLSDLEMRLPHLVESLARRRTRPAPVPEVTLPPRVRPARPPQRARAEAEADPLVIDPELTRRWLVEFLRDELIRRRGFERAVLGLSGGVDSALVAFLAAEALGPDNVRAIRMPYHASSRESLDHAQLVVDATGIRGETVDISAAVDGLAGVLPERPDPARIGNICARMRMITLFDRSASLKALPLGTGNNRSAC